VIPWEVSRAEEKVSSQKCFILAKGKRGIKVFSRTLELTERADALALHRSIVMQIFIQDPKCGFLARSLTWTPEVSKALVFPNIAGALIFVRSERFTTWKWY
jgi:hypothetical protein